VWAQIIYILTCLILDPRAHYEACCSFRSAAA
jgi:hypothetical protein